MKVLGFTFPMIVVLTIVFVVGAKNPGLLARIPLLNRL